MHRRAFITFLGGAAVAWPLAARAQQAALPVVGFLHPGTPDGSESTVAAFRKGLSEVGFTEGRNVALEFRWARNNNDRLAELAAELVRLRVAVIATPSSTAAAIAAKSQTATIPIVFSIGSDPVQAGLVASFNRPGGNATGISSMNVELIAKRVGLLGELVPKAARFAFLGNPTIPTTESQIADARAAASALGRQVEPLYASSFSEIETAFASLGQRSLGQRGVDALMVAPGAPFNERRVQISTLAARHGLPSIFAGREWIQAGGLMSYGPLIADEFRLAGLYTGRVLRGEKPADLPVMQPTKFELLINLQTARALGIEVPPTLLALADEVIE
jgi:putative ABC transport system substrate-binding protein